MPDTWNPINVFFFHCCYSSHSFSSRGVWWTSPVLWVLVSEADRHLWRQLGAAKAAGERASRILETGETAPPKPEPTQLWSAAGQRPCLPPVRISKERADGILSCSEPARACKPGGLKKQQGGQLRDHPSGLKPQQHGPGEPGPFARAGPISVWPQLMFSVINPLAAFGAVPPLKGNPQCWPRLHLLFGRLATWAQPGEGHSVGERGAGGSWPRCLCSLWNKQGELEGLLIAPDSLGISEGSAGLGRERAEGNIPKNQPVLSLFLTSPNCTNLKPITNEALLGRGHAAHHISSRSRKQCWSERRADSIKGCTCLVPSVVPLSSRPDVWWGAVWPWEVRVRQWVAGA